MLISSTVRFVCSPRIDNRVDRSLTHTGLVCVIAPWLRNVRRVNIARLLSRGCERQRVSRCERSAFVAAHRVDIRVLIVVLVVWRRCGKT